MNIMNKLTLKHIKKNKARSIVTIIGIIISVAMLTAVTTGISSGMRWFRNGEIEQSGKWHAEFAELSADQWQQLKEMSDFEEVFATKEIGYAIAPNSLSKRKPYIYLRAYDASALKDMPIKLFEGRLPSKENEIILSKAMAGAGKDALKIGDTISYQFGQRFLKDTGNEAILASYGIVREVPLKQIDQYLDGTTKLYNRGDESNNTTTASEELRLNDKKQTYTIVGIIENPNYSQEPYTAAGYSAYTYLDDKALAADETINGYCYYKDVTHKIYDDMKTTAKQLGVENPSTVNDHVLYYEGVSPDSSFTAFIKFMYITLIAIIVIGSVSLIYNSFAISISERSKQLGMLASVGATKRQKRNSVFFEAFIYGIIGIPVGILSGLLGITIAFGVVSNMIMNSFEITVPLVTIVSAKTILASILLAVITILISAYIPARKASRISAIDAIRQTNDIKVRVKKVRTLWITKKLFGFEGELATKNMKRNRRRYRSIIFSLFISVVLFVTVSSYLHYVTGAYFMVNGTTKYDISLNIYSQEKLSEEKVKDREINLVSEFKQNTNLSSISAVRSMSVPIGKKELAPYYSEEMKEYIQTQNVSGFETESPHYITLQSLDDASFEAYCKENGIDSGKVRETENGVILLNVLEPRANYTVKRIPIVNMKSGDRITTRELKEEDINKNATTLTVVATSTELPVNQTEYPRELAYDYIMIVPEKNFDSIYHAVENDMASKETSYVSSIYVSAKDHEAVYRQMESILSENKVSSDDYSMENIAKTQQGNRQILYAMSIFAYGFIILMSMICCTNMCNTISTSIALRRTEFAMLKSVGMTPKKFHRMIRFESLLYGVKALAYGIPVSLGCSYVIYRYVDARFTVGFLLPWYIYAIVVALVFGVVGSAMLYSSTKIRKENIIDGLKNELS